MAADATLALGTSLTINSFLAKTSTPAIDAGDLAFYGRVGWLDPSWNLYAEYTDIQDNFNAEVGFVPRRGIRTTKIHVGPTPRPKKFNIREMLPMVNVTYTTDQANRLLSRMVHYMIGFRMENGAFLNFIYNRFFEQLDEPFFIHPDVTIPAGTYRFGAWVFQFYTNPSRRVYERFRYSPQTFFGGTRTDLDAVMGFRVTERFAAEMQYRRNDVALPGGSFDVNLGILRLDYSLSPQMSLRSLFQYNSATRQASVSARFNFRYRAGSDLYVAYDELRDDRLSGTPVTDRRLAVKVSYLFSR